MFAVDGNNSALRVTRLDLAMSGQSIQAQAAVDASDDYRDFFFTADVVANSIPYSFTGNIMPGIMTHITGNYGFTAAVYDNGEDGFTGELTLGNFPLAFSKYIFSFSAAMDFSWSTDAGLRATVASLEAEEINNAIPVNPHILLSGALNNNSFRIAAIVYSDSVSQLNGQGNVTWSFYDSGLKTLALVLSAENPLGAERVSAQVNVSSLAGPDRPGFSPRSFMDDYHFSARADVSGLLAGHFWQNQSRNDSLSAQFTAQGTFASPFVTLTVGQSSVTLVSGRLTASGKASLEDNLLDIAQVNAKWGAHELHDGGASFSLADFTGEAAGEYFFNFGEKSITAPLEASFISDGPSTSAETGKKGFPRSFVLLVSSSGCEGPAFSAPKPFSLRAVRRPGRLDIRSLGTESIAFWMLDSGELEFKLGGALPVRFNAHGSVAGGRTGGFLPPANGALDVAVENINIDIASFAPFLDFSVFAAYKGVIEGNIHAGGTLSAPDFNGALTLTNIEISSPQFAPAHFTSPYVFASVSESSLEVYDALLQSGNSSRMTLDLVLALDRWAFEILNLRFAIADNTTVPVNARLDRIYTRCDVSGTIDIEVQRETVAVTGSLRAQNGTFELAMTDFEGVNLLAAVPGLQLQQQQPPQPPASTADVVANLKVVAGTRMQVLVNTVQNGSAIGVRGLVSQGTEVQLLVDSLNEMLEIQGDVTLRGGEIMYFNRNFYLREGRIVFNETMGGFDPRITIRAETRERDSEGEQVRIILSADNQLLSQFNPLFSSSPAKSEAEIMHILGQIVTGDSESLDDLAFAVLDYGVQMAVLRKIETGLRELLNLDIFSMRSMIVQNVLRSQVDAQRGEGPLAAGSVFDNSTVYAGKYFGSSIYADALLHVSYDENEILSKRSETGIVIQPEFGLEMMSPYVTIRWSIAPELGKTDFLWVDATSITLSWKFNF